MATGGLVGIDMPLGLLESGWREADRVARRLAGARRSSVFAIPPRAVWAEASYALANQRCRELTGQGLSVQAWGLRVKLLEANRYWETCGRPLYGCTRSWRSAHWPGRRSRPASTPRPGATCAAGCWLRRASRSPARFDGPAG